MGERDELIVSLNHADSFWLILGADGITCRSVHIVFIQRKDQIDTVNKSSAYRVIEKPSLSLVPWMMKSFPTKSCEEGLVFCAVDGRIRIVLFQAEWPNRVKSFVAADNIN